jgi:hypothetical protein
MTQSLEFKRQRSHDRLSWKKLGISQDMVCVRNVGTVGGVRVSAPVSCTKRK